MNKVWIVTPTVILIIIVITGLMSSGSTHNNLLAYGSVGLALYSFFAIFIYGLVYYTKNGHLRQKMPAGVTWLFVYLIAVLTITVVTMIYFMAHN
ncbi:LasU family protein [Paucilactobacillus sp. N302-9]